MRDLSSCNVLLVDDTEANIDILVETLGDEYDITVAMDGENALELVTETLPDLILLDIMMPGMDGYEVIRRLKADDRTKDVPVVFCTAMTETTDETKGLELGAVDYIRKPFSPSMVKARVRNHLQLKLAQEDLLKQNEVLKENVRLRDEVERMTRHDLKTPLNSVITVPRLLIQEGNISEDQVEMLQMLEESGYRMLEIINSSQDLYKMETGQYQLHEIPVDLLKLVYQIRGETRELIRQKELELFVWMDGNPAKETDEFIVAGEEMLCYSMLANLIKNAVEASPVKDAITISLTNIEGPLVSIQNKGVVPEEIRDRFFEKYVTAGKEGGTGLGTYSANLIAKTLGGKLEFESSEEAGTMLNIYLPAYVEEDEDETPEEKITIFTTKKGVPAPAAGWRPLLTNRSRVLIVDDYLNMRRTIMSILKQMGFTLILEADDGMAAREKLEHNHVGLVISDWNMPQMTGLELLQYARSRLDLKDMPFIMVTGEALQQNVIEAAKSNVNEYIVKPFTADALKKKIEKYME